MEVSPSGMEVRRIEQMLASRHVVMILGKASTGKSSLIDWLMGKKIRHRSETRHPVIHLATIKSDGRKLAVIDTKGLLGADSGGADSWDVLSALRKQTTKSIMIHRLFIVHDHELSEGEAECNSSLFIEAIRANHVGQGKKTIVILHTKVDEYAMGRERSDLTVWENLTKGCNDRFCRYMAGTHSGLRAAIGKIHMDYVSGTKPCVLELLDGRISRTDQSLRQQAIALKGLISRSLERFKRLVLEANPEPIRMQDFCTGSYFI